MAVRRARKTINVKWVWWALERNGETKLALYEIRRISIHQESWIRLVPPPPKFALNITGSSDLLSCSSTLAPPTPPVLHDYQDYQGDKCDHYDQD